MSGLPAGITHGIAHMTYRLQRAIRRTDRPVRPTRPCDAVFLPRSWLYLKCAESASHLSAQSISQVVATLLQHSGLPEHGLGHRTQGPREVLRGERLGDLLGLDGALALERAARALLVLGQAAVHIKVQRAVGSPLALP